MHKHPKGLGVSAGGELIDTDIKRVAGVIVPSSDPPRFISVTLPNLNVL